MELAQATHVTTSSLFLTGGGLILAVIMTIRAYGNARRQGVNEQSGFPVFAVVLPILLLVFLGLFGSLLWFRFK